MIKVRFIGLYGHDSKTFSSFKDLTVWLADKFREADMFLNGNFEILDIFEIIDIEKMDKTNE